MNTETVYFVTVEEKFAQLFHTVLTHMDLDALYDEKHKEDASIFFYSYSPSSDELCALDEGSFRVCLYEAQAVVEREEEDGAIHKTPTIVDGTESLINFRTFRIIRRLHVIFD